MRFNTTFEAKYCAAFQGLLRTMALIPPKTLKERVKECVRTRSYDLTTAFVAAQPVVIGQALVQALLISPDVMDMGNIPSFEQASKILGAISRHIETNPEPALKCFIKVLRESNDASLRKIADDMAREMGYVIHDARNPAPVSTLPADHAQEPARDKTPITRDVQMDSNGEEPGKSGRVVKDGASASNTDMTTTRDKIQSPYKMNKDSHGVALIINNIEWQQDTNGRPLMRTRDGAKEDADALKESLEAIGYLVICKENLTADKMKQKLQKVCAENVRPGDDSFICYISSHGGQLGVFGVDKKCVTVDELSKILEPDVCSKLKHKPKIFFVQACRGSLASEPKGIDSDDENIIPSVPRRADFYFSYATDPDHVAVRHPYPQLLSKYLKEHSAQLSLNEIVMKVHEKIARRVYEIVLQRQYQGHMQIGQVVHTMRGPVYFK